MALKNLKNKLKTNFHETRLKTKLALVKLKKTLKRKTKKKISIEKKSNLEIDNKVIPESKATLVDSPIDVNKPKRKILQKLLIAFGVIMLFLTTFGVLYAYDRWQGQVQKVSQYTVDGELVKEACTNIVNPECWTEAFQPELLKDNNKTAILIIGSDARNNSAFIGNTDSLMLAVYDHGTKQLKTISFPRDLLAPYQYKEGGNTYYAKINSIYAVGN